MKPYDRTLLDIYAAEQADHVQRLRGLTAVLSSGPADARSAGFADALRRAHTLKGAARAVGLENTERLAHRLESLLARARDRRSGLDEPEIEAIHHVLDALEDIVASVLGNRPEPDTSPVIRELDALAGVAPVEPASPPPPESTPVAPPETPAPHGAEFVRVSAAHIDELVRTSSQMLAAAGAESIAENRAADALSSALESVTDFQRLRRECSAYLRKYESDPEAGSLRECIEYADRCLHHVLTDARAAAALAHQRAYSLRQRATELHQNAVRVRMIPAESVFAGFGAMVRDIAHSEQKQVEYRVDGLETEADRVVLQGLKDPVMHLLRNAVSHGIEPAEERIAAGKSPTGTIHLRLESNGGRLQLTVEDDGRGLDVQAIGAEALRQGLLTDADLAGQSPEELARLIFRPGFSTSGSVTSISGRGMGMSVVEESVARLQGDIKLQRRPGAGLVVTISAALSISTQHILLLLAGGHIFGIPTRFVHQLHRIRRSDVQTVAGRDVATLHSRPVPLVPLISLLGLAPGARSAELLSQGSDPALRVVVLVSGEQMAGVTVDECLDERDAMVKDLGMPPGMSGLTAGGLPLDDGTVAPLLNAIALFDRLAKVRLDDLKKPGEESHKPPPRILVVDDSITTRSLERSILEAHGYEVRLAVDGVEALQKLGAERFDLVITDVMMPRMDGFELLQEMKKRKQTERIPVVLVTSLERPEDQQRGLALGADAYIVKRKFDQRELLNTVRQIV